MTEPIIAICMGSTSDLPTMEPAAKLLAEFEVPFEVRILSAHRTPAAMASFAENARERGLKMLIAGAGGAAHLPGMLAAFTPLPVIGVPVNVNALGGVDALLSIVQMPKGTPVATVGVGQAINAAHLALRFLALSDPAIRQAVDRYRSDRVASVRRDDEQTRARWQAFIEKGDTSDEQSP